MSGPSAREDPQERPAEAVRITAEADRITEDAQPSIAGAHTVGPHNAGPHLVGIGASAGGLEALERLFKGMPAATGVAFVVIQHLSTDFKSHMEQLLARQTSIRITKAKDGVRVEADTIYLIPAGTMTIIDEGRLLLTDRDPEGGLSLPIDMFFRSLALDAGSRAIAVVLSGTGTDGSRGLQDVHEADGLVIVQEPETCGFRGMPDAAINTGFVHAIAAPEEIPCLIERFVEDGIRSNGANDTLMSESEGEFGPIIEALESAYRIDFGLYKQTTVGRRIRRRMEFGGHKTAAEFADALRSDRSALYDLYHDILIGVTSFRRDERAFACLEREVLPVLLKRKRPGDTLRVWIPGCATGEEAYSIAMCIAEATAALDLEVSIKIFATDVDVRSINVATRGVYDDDALAELPRRLRHRYFVKDATGGNRVVTSLRKTIVFAEHNLLSQPPFTRQDLIVCRNLLIYFQPASQQRVLSLFHFSLRPNGVIFLGPSETLGALADEFTVIDKRWRIFKKRRDVRIPIAYRPASRPSTGSEAYPVPKVPRTRLSDERVREENELYARLLEEQLPPSVLITSAFEIKHMFGGFAGLLRMTGLRPSSNLLQLLPAELTTMVSGAVTRAIRERRPVRYTGIRLDTGTGDQTCTMIVDSLGSTEAPKPELLLKFVPNTDAQWSDRPAASTDRSPPENVDEATLTHIRRLEQELTHTRENLQTTVEELETSNEELQSANEELVAGNEELQSTNEELQSVNEELFTVNVEYQSKIDELQQANSDMDNLLVSTEVGVLFLDASFRLRRFTPEITRQFGLLQSDVGTPVDRLAYAFGLDSLETAMRTELEASGRFELELTTQDQRHYLLRAIPYRNSLGDDGVVGTLTDISSIRKANAEVERFKFITDRSPDALSMVDGDGRFTYVNDQFCRLSGYTHAEALKLQINDIDPGLPRAIYADLFDEVHRDGPRTFEARSTRKNGEVHPVETTTSPFVFEESPYLFMQGRDITERRLTNQRLKLEHRIAAMAAEAASLPAAVDGFLAAIIEVLEVDAAEFWRFEYVNGIYCPQGRVRRHSYLVAPGMEGAEAWIAVMTRGDIAPGVGLLGEAWLSKIAIWVQDLASDERHGHAAAAAAAGFNHACVLPILDGDTVVGVLAFYLHRTYGEPTALLESLASAAYTMGQACRRLETERALRLRERAVEATQDGIVIADARLDDLPLVYVNSGFERTTGYSASDALYRNCRFLQGEDTAPETVKAIREALATNTPIRTTILNYKKDGTPFWNELQISPVLSDSGEVEHFVSVQHDITARMKFEEELELARRTATEANDAKSRFLANMSHEIRTPMAAILGFADSLRDEVVTKEGRERLGVIKRNGKYLLQLINDILDLSKVEAGVLEIELCESRLPELLADVLELLDVRAESAPAELRFEALTPLPETVVTDPIRLRQILVNLVGNALKFTTSGHVCVRASVVEVNELPALRIDVEDTGIGIASESLDRIFEPFRQVRNPSDLVGLDHGGTGLGLTITRRLVQALGGRIEVLSELGVGSTFSIILPTGPIVEGRFVDWKGPDCSTEGDGARVGSPPDLTGCSVLVADDKRDVGRVARFYLEDVGATVTVVANGREALDAVVAAEVSFDVILMDIQMPIMDGLAATEELRKIGYTGRIVALTAGAMPDEVARCYDVGCDVFLAKPVEEDTLLDTVYEQWRRPADG